MKGINHLMVHGHHANTSYLCYRNRTILKFVSGGKIVQFEPDLKQDFSEVLLHSNESFFFAIFSKGKVILLVIVSLLKVY